MNEVLVIACLGWWWQHFTLFWSPAPVWCQPPLRGTLSCHAVATSPQLPRPQWSKLQTVQRAGSGTNIALCHHYFNNFEYFEYFNHWVTPWLQVPIFQSFSFNWECIASVHGSWTQFWVFYKLLPWHLVTMWHWPEVMPDVRPEQGRPHQPMGGRPPLPAGGASASHSRERKKELRSGHGPPPVARSLATPDTQWSVHHPGAWHHDMRVMAPVSGAVTDRPLARPLSLQASSLCSFW